MTLPNFRRSALPLAAFAVALCAGAARAADNFSCTLTASSTLSYTLSANAPLINSSFHGAYLTIPSPPSAQTRTKVPNAGFSGGCSSIGATQNDNVPVSGTGTANGNGSGYHPTGTFNIVLAPADPAVGVATIRNMNLNLLGGGMASVTAQVSNFGITSTFCTVNPGCNAIIPLSGLTLPLGTATVSGVTAVQTGGDAVGTLTPTAPNEWDFSVTVSLVVSTDVVFGGNPLPTAPQTVPATLAGHIVRSGVNITVTASAAINLNQSDPTDVPIVDQAVTTSGLPICNGLNLLFNATIDSTTVMLNTNSSVAAGGPQVPCRCDWNGNFAWDVSDVFAFISSWFMHAPGTDFNANSTFDVGDIFAFLGCWFAHGC